MRKALLSIAMIVFISIFIFSGYRIVSKILDYKKIDDAYDEIADLVVQSVSAPSAPADRESSDTERKETESEFGDVIATETTDGVNSTYEHMLCPIQVDFDVLREINPDIVGWIYCEGTSINYPVLQGETNDTYLYHQYDGTYSSGGSIFMDYRCEGDFSDDYTVIYGHNMLADSMFNCLDYFRKQSYLDEHSRFFYLTPSGKNYCLEVICVNLTAYKDELRLFEIRDSERNLELIRSQADADTGIEADNDDQLVLLATCTYDFNNAKCTLLCKAIELKN